MIKDAINRKSPGGDCNYAVNLRGHVMNNQWHQKL
jgi:hypothetical protein